MDAKKQWVLLTAAACLAILVGGWFVLVTPARSHAASLRTQKASVDTQVTTLRGQLHRLLEQSRTIAAKQAELDLISRQIPDNPQLPSLTRALDGAASAAGVDLVNLAPGAPVFAPVATVAPTAATPASAASAATVHPAVVTPGALPVEALAMMPITLNLSGGYAEVEQFLMNLESLPRSFLVSGFTITPNATVTAAAASPTVAQGAPAVPVGPQPGRGELTVTITGRVFLTATAPVVSVPAAPATATK